MNRRKFLTSSILGSLFLSGGTFTSLKLIGYPFKTQNKFGGKILTVSGPIQPSELGYTLPHEHILVDFAEADVVGKHRYDRQEVYETMLPHLEAIKQQGIKGFMECTPNYLGRDPELLLKLSEATGLHILTNTGLYKEPHLPGYAFSESAEQLTERWVKEIENGIEDTGVHAGFIKIAVFPESLKPIQQKIVRAACKTHNRTGATIACHTAHGPAAMEILDILENEQTPAHALIVVHAAEEKDISYHYKIAERGAWVEYDNIGAWPVEDHLNLLDKMLNKGYDKQILLSMDRGWYHVGEEGGGKVKPFTFFDEVFVPEMKDFGVPQSTIDQIKIDNPANAFMIDA